MQALGDDVRVPRDALAVKHYYNELVPARGLVTKLWPFFSANVDRVRMVITTVNVTLRNSAIDYPSFLSCQFI